MKSVVVTKNLTRKFGDFTAVDQLNISINKGELYGFLGPNGAGKSTTIKMLCGILEPTSGTGTILNYDLLSETDAIKSRIGYMSQKFSLYEDLTVKENMNFYAGIYNLSKKEKRERITELIETVQLHDVENELVENLSSGWKQRVALSCAIISKPALLFLDEPTSGVSPTSRREFFDIIQDIAHSGTTIMISTHFMDEAERCHRIAFISNGLLLAMDTPENLKRNVLEGYLVQIKIPDFMNKIQEIETLPYVKDCSIHGSVLHVLLKEKTNAFIFEKWCGVKVKPIIPSLEDVFLSLVKGQREGGRNELK
ncbi:MAG: ABC transporter ATP-binding protein [Clostridia bacterium]|nr:ABC transporter ATP-binding protein [Clostridia bacterium]